MDKQEKSGESPAEKKDGEQKAIVEQPKGNDIKPSAVSVVPAVPIILVRGGLDGLAYTSHLFVRQRIELMEVIGGCERPNQYEVYGTNGTGLYFMKEDTNCCVVVCLGTGRPFIITVLDHNMQPVFFITRNCADCCCATPCCGHSVKVSLPDGTLLGSVVQRCNCCTPTFDVLDHKLQPVLKIRGPGCCMCNMCCHVEFDLLDLNGVKVGAIHKQWAGAIQEFFTDATNFGIEFPPSLSVIIKAVLLGAVILLDFAYFEKDNKRGA